MNRAFGWLLGSSESGSSPALPVDQVCRGSSVRPSHQMSPSSVSATLVKIELPHSVFTALALVFIAGAGATPKKPASGLIA